MYPICIVCYGKVPAETLKQSLQKLGLKCGGTPEDRAARFFQLKTIKLEDAPWEIYTSTIGIRQQATCNSLATVSYTPGQ